jgi:hypothetical protein
MGVMHKSLNLCKNAYAKGAQIIAAPMVTTSFICPSVFNSVINYLVDSFPRFALTQITQNTHEVQIFTPVCGRPAFAAIRNRIEFWRC